jgi:hypothetical protein
VTDTATDTDTPAPTASATPSATRTDTAEPTALAALVSPVAAEPQATPSAAAPPPTFTPLPTPIELGPGGELPTESPSEPPSATPAPSETPQPTPTVEPSATPTQSPSATPTGSAAVEVQPTAPIAPATPSGAGPSGTGPLDNLPPEAAALGLGAGLLIVYGLFFMAGAAEARRYAEGFVLDTCPVCSRGRLSLVERRRRVLGIPRVRRTVHCDYCGSVLRETGRGRWRYTVDDGENKDLYRRYNGRVVRDSELIALGEAARVRRASTPPPEYFEPPRYIENEPPEQ